MIHQLLASVLLLAPTGCQSTPTPEFRQPAQRDRVTVSPFRWTLPDDRSASIDAPPRAPQTVPLPRADGHIASAQTATAAPASPALAAVPPVKAINELAPATLPKVGTATSPSGEAVSLVTVTRTLDVKAYGAKMNGTTDDSAAIQKALNAARAGDLVTSPSGGVASLRSGVVLAGKSDVVVNLSIKLAKVPSQLLPTLGPCTFMVSKSQRCHITLNVDGNGIGSMALGSYASSSIYIEDCVISDIGKCTAAIGGVQNSGNVYQRNQISDTASECRGMWIGTNWLLDVNPLIDRNVISRAGGTAIGSHSTGARISRNVISNCKGAGVKLGVKSRDGIVEYNTATGCAFHGFQDDATSGDAVKNVTVRYNTFNENAHCGIYIIRMTGSVTGNTCKDNTEYGIYVLKDANVTCSGNTLSGNDIKNFRDDS